MQRRANSIKIITRADFCLAYSVIDDLFVFSSEHLQQTKRYKERYGVQILKKNILAESSQILYEKNGRPYLHDHSAFISISHSKNFIALAKSSKRIGIDIEEIDSRILKVRERILNTHEMKIFQANDLLENTIAWTIKETLFKLTEDDGLDFRTDLLILEEISPRKKYRCSMKQSGSLIKVLVEIIKVNNLVIAFNV